MKPGELVIHRPSGRRMTVKTASGNNGMTLCAWMEKDAHGRPVECSSAFAWEDLRYPTEAERGVGVSEVAPLPSLGGEKVTRIVEPDVTPEPAAVAVAEEPEIVGHPKRRK